MEVIMSKFYCILTLLAAMPALAMERPHDGANTNNESFQLNFSDLEQELIRITDEPQEKNFSPESIDQDPYARIRATLLDIIDDNESEKNIPEQLVVPTPKPMPSSYPTKNRIQAPKEIKSENTPQKFILQTPEQKKAIADLFYSQFAHIIKLEKSLKNAINTAASPKDIESIKQILDADQKSQSAEWLSDVQENTLDELTAKFGFNDQCMQMALSYRTPGALTWLSKQEKACKTIPLKTLEELLTDARMAFHNCDELKTVALIKLLDNTSFKTQTKEALFRALAANIQTIDSLKNKQEMLEKIINRIHILGHAQYNFKEQPVLMKHALASGFPQIASMLEHYGLINPNRPCLPFFVPEKPHTNSSVTLEKIYAKKDTGQRSEEFTWSPKVVATKKSSSKYVKFIN
jgi:hypothetical protein